MIQIDISYYIIILFGLISIVVFLSWAGCLRKIKFTTEKWGPHTIVYRDWSGKNQYVGKEFEKLSREENVTKD